RHHRALPSFPTRRSSDLSASTSAEPGATVWRAVRLAVAAAATAAVLAPAAHAGVILGVHGNAPRFASQTGQQSQIGLTFVSFAQGNALGRVAAAIGPVPMIALNTGSYGAAQTATSRGIALGQNDRFLFQLNA